MSLLVTHGVIPTVLTESFAGPAAQTVAASIWAVAAVAAARVHLKRRAVEAWVPAFFGLLAIGHAVRIGAPLSQTLLLAGNAIVVAGLALAMAAAMWELRWLLRSQDRLSLSLRLDMNALNRQMEGERASLEERLHDLRNAVAAMRSADTTLRRYSGQLDPASRDRLADALSAELGRLQTLIEPARRSEPVEFSLFEVLAPVVSIERSYGANIELEVAESRAQGDPTAMAQVVQNLLVNARRYAPGSTVRITARSGVDRVELRVADGGPGIAAHERRRVFARGTRGATSRGIDGDGLGLFVAARLMTEMGGSLWLVDEDGPGACFVAEVPAAMSASPPASASPRRSGRSWLRSVS